MEIFNKILHSYAIYCRKEMVIILKGYFISKKSYDTMSKGAIFFGQPCIYIEEKQKIPFQTKMFDMTCSRLPVSQQWRKQRLDRFTFEQIKI